PHHLRARAEDPATNLSTDSFFDVFVDLTPPQVTSAGPVTPSPRGTPVSTLDVVLSEPIDLGTFDYHDLTLTRNGAANLVTSAVTVALVSGNTYRLSGLDSLTASDGTYLLTVSGSGLQDLAGNPGVGSSSAGWVTVNPKSFDFNLNNSFTQP